MPLTKITNIQYLYICYIQVISRHPKISNMLSTKSYIYVHICTYMLYMLPTNSETYSTIVDECLWQVTVHYNYMLDDCPLWYSQVQKTIKRPSRFQKKKDYSNYVCNDLHFSALGFTIRAMLWKEDINPLKKSKCSLS